MADPLTVDRLVRLGLTQYEARAYVALIGRDTSTPAEIARLARVPRPRIYDVLASLAGRGLATERPGRTTRFVATAPERVAQVLVDAHRERVAALETDARAVVEALAAAYRERERHTDPLDYIEVIRAPEAVAARFNELQSRVQREMLVFSKLPAAVSVEANVVGMRLARRGVLRSLYEFSVLRDPAARAGVRDFVAAGEDARFVEELPMKLGIIDEHIVLFAMPDPIPGGADVTTLVIEHPHLAGTLKLAFESVWAGGVAFAQACERAGVDPEGPADPIDQEDH